MQWSQSSLTGPSAVGGSALLMLLFVLVVRMLSIQYSLTGRAGAAMVGLAREDMAFEAREECFHGCIPTCHASSLTVSLDLAASFAVLRVKKTSLSPGVGAANFLVVVALERPRPDFRCFYLLFFVFPIVVLQQLNHNIEIML